MIDIKTKIHDKFSIEFKVGFVARRKIRKNDFTVGVWLFLPDSLDINSSTYAKSDFYKDVKSNIRLITPRFLLRDIVGGEAIHQLTHHLIFQHYEKVTYDCLRSTCCFRFHFLRRP